MSIVDPMMIAKILAGTLIAPRAAPAGKSALVISLYAFSGMLIMAAVVILLIALHTSVAVTYTPGQTWAITGGATLGLGLIAILVAGIISNKRHRVIHSHIDDTGKALLAALDSATQGLEEPIAGHPRSSMILASLAGYLAGNKLH